MMRACLKVLKLAGKTILLNHLRRLNCWPGFAPMLPRQGDRDRALEAGCDDYATKPIDFPALLAKIEAMLAR